MRIAAQVREQGSCKHALHKSLPRGPDSERIRAFLFSPPVSQPDAPHRAAHMAALRRRIVGTRMFFNKLPRGNAGTGRLVRLAICGCSSAGRARPCHGRGHGFETHHPLHFGCVLAPLPSAAVGTAGRDVHGVAPHVQREHLAGSPATRAWAQPKWTKNLARSLREAETGRKDWAAPELVTGTHKSPGPLTQWPECLPVQEEAAGSTPARAAIHAAIAQTVERCVESAGVGGSIPSCGANS
jgi:hypothetical protein